MKKNNIIVILLLFTILLGACSIKGSGAISLSGNSEKADARLEQILDILQDKDVEALSKVFSTKATDANDNFEEDAISLFDFFQGEFVSWTQDAYTLRVIKVEDEETEVGYVEDMTIPGIYIPKE